MKTSKLNDIKQKPKCVIIRDNFKKEIKTLLGKRVRVFTGGDAGSLDNILLITGILKKRHTTTSFKVLVNSTSWTYFEEESIEYIFYDISYSSAIIKLKI